MEKVPLAIPTALALVLNQSMDEQQPACAVESVPLSVTTCGTAEIITAISVAPNATKSKRPCCILSQAMSSRIRSTQFQGSLFPVLCVQASGTTDRIPGLLSYVRDASHPGDLTERRMARMGGEHNPVRLQSADRRNYPPRFSDLSVGGHTAFSNVDSVIICLRLHPEVTNKTDRVFQIVDSNGAVVHDDIWIRERL